MKSISENPNGLYKRFVLRKIVGWKNEGFFGLEKPIAKAVDKDAEYFVLRLDNGGSDVNHINACRIAVNAYADAIEPHIPQLAKDLKERYPVSPSPDSYKEVKEETNQVPDGYVFSFYAGLEEIESGVMCTNKEPMPIYLYPVIVKEEMKELSEWINVKDKLPDYYKLVICKIQDSSHPVLCWRANNGDDDIWTISGSDWLVKNEIITDWKYFPVNVI